MQHYLVICARSWTRQPIARVARVTSSVYKGTPIGQQARESWIWGRRGRPSRWAGAITAWALRGRVAPVWWAVCRRCRWPSRAAVWSRRARRLCSQKVRLKWLGRVRPRGSLGMVGRHVFELLNTGLLFDFGQEHMLEKLNSRES